MSQVHVPLVDLNSGRAVCATLTVGRGPFAQSPELDEAALRDAWRAVCELNGGVPRWMFEQHTFTLAFRGQTTRADGRSLGLAAGLALWALWADRPLSDVDGVGATGTLSPGGHVGLIRGVDAKIEAVARRGATMLIPRGQRERQTLSALEVVAVPDLKTAGRQLGLPPLSAAPEYADLRQLERQIATLTDAVRWQELDDHRDRGQSPWIALGRELEGWTAMHPTPDKERVQQAFLKACEAYMYAGDLPSAAAVIKRLVSASVSDRVALLRDELELRELLTHSDPSVPEVDALIARCAAGLDDETFRANRLGTLGRAYVHTRRPEQGLPLLTQARDAQVPMEIGRSEVYIAMAHRVAGRFDDAHAALKRALEAHETHTKGYCRPYYHSCVMYWEYEMARLLLEQAAHASRKPARKALRRQALEHARMALGCCDALGEPVWPRGGILRLLAWADYHGGVWKKQLTELQQSYDLPDGRMYVTVLEEGLTTWSADAQIW